MKAEEEYREMINKGFWYFAFMCWCSDNELSSSDKNVLKQFGELYELDK